MSDQESVQSKCTNVELKLQHQNSPLVIISGIDSPINESNCLGKFFGL